MAYQSATDLNSARQFAIQNTQTAKVLFEFKDKATAFRQQWFQVLDPANPDHESMYRWIVPVDSDIARMSDIDGEITFEDVWRFGFDVSNACAAAWQARFVLNTIDASIAAQLVAAYNSVFS